MTEENKKTWWIWIFIGIAVILSIILVFILMSGGQSSDDSSYDLIAHFPKDPPIKGQELFY